MNPVIQPWSVRVSMHEIPEAGRHLDLVADEATRAEIAKLTGLTGLPSLSASFDLSRHGRDRLRVVGRVNATVGQICVVTLDPIENEIAEDIDLMFTSEPAIESTKVAEDESADNEVEALVGGAVDLGALATEFLMLGIDPYPRKPGAMFEATTAGEAEDHPFAALAALKKDKP